MKTIKMNEMIKMIETNVIICGLRYWNRVQTEVTRL